MVLDETLTRILHTIQKEVKDKYKQDLSIEQIHNVVDTQIEATKEGFRRGISIHWTRFCKFVYTDKGKRLAEINKRFSELETADSLLPTQIIELKKQIILEKSVEKINRIKEDKYFNGNSFTAEQVLNKPSTSSITMFRLINNKTNKS